MRIGKLDNNKLNELILSKFVHTRKEVICSPQVGVDCAAVDMGGRIAVLSTDPITAAAKHIGTLTVHVSCNDAAAAGAEPIGLLTTLLAPPSITEDEIAEIADELSTAAKEANVEIIGGHTEITDAVTRVVTSAAVIAKAGARGILTPGGMKEGDSVVLTKWICLEGTAIIASEFAGRLDGITEAELDEARDYMKYVSVVKEGLFAYEHGAHAMHDITEGGVFGAAWEMSEASGVGMEICEECIPIKDVTRKMCAALDIDPMRLISSGAMLIACPNGEEIVKGLKEMGINAAVIGTAGGEGVRTASGKIIAPPGADELYKLYK